MNMESIANSGVQTLSPYQPGKPVTDIQREFGLEHVVKLASNENPLGPGNKAKAAITGFADDLARYPDPNGFALKQALCDAFDLHHNMLTLGNGSNDVLVLLAQAFLRPGTNSIFSQYAFEVYAIATQIAGAQAKVVPALGPDSSMPLGHDLQGMLDRVDTNTQIVFIANPNNPTGTWIGAKELQSFLDQLPQNVICVLDEAYVEYEGFDDTPDAMNWVKQYPNLVVTRTFSKAHGLAGLRVGFAVAQPQITDLLNRVRQPFNVNAIGQSAAIAALSDDAHLKASRDLNRAGMQGIADIVQGHGMSVVPSAANFIMVDCGRPAQPIFHALLKQGVIVRPVANYGLPNHLRITIGTQEENAFFAQAWEKVMQMNLAAS